MFREVHNVGEPERSINCVCMMVLQHQNRKVTYRYWEARQSWSVWRSYVWPPRPSTLPPRRTCIPPDSTQHASNQSATSEWRCGSSTSWRIRISDLSSDITRQSEMTDSRSLRHTCDACGLTHHESWSGIQTAPHLHPDPSSSIWVKPQATTNAWSRSVEAGRIVSFRFKLCSKVG